MAPTPTGRLQASPDGTDLVLTRSFAATIEDVWASITEPEWTARWFASWEGDARPGATIRYTMPFEGEGPPSDMRIEACAPPHHLEVSTTVGPGTWRLRVDLSAVGDGTELRLAHRLDASADPAEVGPGWEYYLDNLVAARAGTALPDFDDYFPAQSAYYSELRAH